MIRGLHGLFFSTDPAATRAFLRDVLRLPSRDIGEGWLIFDLPEGEMGVHPLDEHGKPGAGTHLLSFYCDDLEETLADLQLRGATVVGGIMDRGFGLVAELSIPGGVTVDLYQPKYPSRPSPKKGAPGRSMKAAPKKGSSRPSRRPTRRR